MSLFVCSFVCFEVFVRILKLYVLELLLEEPRLIDRWFDRWVCFCVRISMRVFVYLFMYVFVYVYLRVSVCVCIYMCMCMHIYVYICMYVYISPPVGMSLEELITCG